MGEMKLAQQRSELGPALQKVVQVIAANGSELERFGQGAGDRANAIALGQQEDAPDVPEGVKLALAQRAEVGLSLGAKGQEASQQRRVFASLALLEQPAGVIGVGDLLAAAIGAGMLNEGEIL